MTIMFRVWRFYIMNNGECWRLTIVSKDLLPLSVSARAKLSGTINQTVSRTKKEVE